MSLSAKDRHIRPVQCLANKRLARWLQLDPMLPQNSPRAPWRHSWQNGKPFQLQEVVLSRGWLFLGDQRTLSVMLPISQASLCPLCVCPHHVCLGWACRDGQARILNPTAADLNCSCSTLGRRPKRLRLNSWCWLVLTVRLTQP